MKRTVEELVKAASMPNPHQEPLQMTVTVDPASMPNFEALAELTKQLPETDDLPMESPWHLGALTLLIEILTYCWRDRHDFYVGGNMFLYYSLRHLRSEDFKGPDFFYVAGVDRHRPREAWVVWDEGGKYPDVIVEILSRTTAEVDRTVKKAIYEETFRTGEYFTFDPDGYRLEGWRLQGSRYQPVAPDERGRMWSNALQLWLGPWTGEYHGLQATWLRFYDAQGQLVLLETEAEQQRADAERQRADAERQRADAAESELGRLKARLAELEQAGPGQPPAGGTNR